MKLYKQNWLKDFFLDFYSSYYNNNGRSLYLSCQLSPILCISFALLQNTFHRRVEQAHSRQNVVALIKHS